MHIVKEIRCGPRYKEVSRRGGRRCGMRWRQQFHGHGALAWKARATPRSA